MLPVDLQILKYLLFEKPIYHFKIKPYLKWHSYEQLQNNLLEHTQGEGLDQKPLEELDFTIFDLETTGFLPEIGHEIISIGAIRLNGLHACRREKFHQVIRPIRPVNNQTLKLTGLTKERLKNASPFIDGFQNFMSFSEGSVLVAHPAKFDMRFLRTMLKRWKLPDYTPHVIDSQLMAQWLLPNVRHQLDPLLKYVGIDKRDRHHALNDAIMTAELFRYLLSRTIDQNVHTLHHLNQKLAQQKKAKQK
ncbi:DNA polymerase-3 subunit epsilon [Halobacillus dabanensis]|uniref:DNA polymerase-3 subunit epsilon n=1 Tax=Halobacillus dabanensis TaxID=240302 RepID=A0A1I3PMT4_HALDA|nr:exonuclease domain-containing protein [Halobacillus dabanensis]SFJ23044.1 DNA polymerase-3 subunit epsilon [Halobacillus dabanensis]